MTVSQKNYSYRAGRKVMFKKQLDQVVDRVLPEDLRYIGITPRCRSAHRAISMCTGY
jgi:hypothetical protein